MEDRIEQLEERVSTIESDIVILRNALDETINQVVRLLDLLVDIGDKVNG